MKMGICSVHIMDGHLMDVDLVQGYLRLHLKDLKLKLFNLQGHVLLDFLLWFLKDCSLFGLMRMLGRGHRQLSPLCKFLTPHY